MMDYYWILLLDSGLQNARIFVQINKMAAPKLSIAN